MESFEGKLTERPGVLHTDAVVVELDVLHYDAHQSLLPLYGWQDSPVLGVQDYPVTFNTLRNCKETIYQHQCSQGFDGQTHRDPQGGV